MASYNSQKRPFSAFRRPSTTPTPSASPSLSIPPTPIESRSASTPDQWSFLNQKPARPDRSREEVKSRKRRATSVWDYFRNPTNDEPKRDKSGQSLMFCKECDDQSLPWSTAVTTNARAHLSKHFIFLDQDEPKNKKARQQSLQSAFEISASKTAQKTAEEEKETLRAVLNRDAFYEAQVQLIIRRRIPFNCVEWPEYQAILMAINPQVEDLLLESHHTVPEHIERSFKIHFSTVKERLLRAVSQIHYSIDLWSSPN